MQRQDYNWQRFWCPTTGNLNLDYSGFLYDPESKYGNAYNPDLVKFDAISDVPCLILLGEAGIGKTIATKQEYEKVEAKLQRLQDDCLWFSLGDYGSDDSLCNAIFRDERFKAWLNGTYKLHLFLDSLDEGILSIKTLTRILRREIDKLPCNRCDLISRHEYLDRLYLRITCRTAEWKDSLTENFREKWGKDNIGIYELAPLREIDIVSAAEKQSIDADKFLEELADKQAVPLAIKPITLKFLLSIYIKNSRFPLSQKELYEQGCLELCKEVNLDRLDCDFKGKLSEKQRLIVAGIIAVITIFANKVAIWTSSDYLEMPECDIVIQDLCVGQEKIDGQEFDITQDCIKEVLSISGLFSSRGTNRIGFAHKTYAEFLAALYLSHHQIPLVQIMSLIVSPQDAERKLVPQLHETTAWLASMNRKVLEKIMTTDPDVLLYSDISEDRNLREAIVSNLLEQYEQEKLFDRGLGNHLRYKKLKHPKLAEQLRSYIKDNNKNFNARYEAINIAEVCEVKELQDDLVNLALDRTQQIHLRSIAASTITTVGDSNTKLKLKPLAVKELPEDEEDSLKGNALRAVWSEHLTAQELFSIFRLELTTPPHE
jgi:predicted NACHT family NTPase